MRTAPKLVPQPLSRGGQPRTDVSDQPGSGDGPGPNDRPAALRGGPWWDPDEQQLWLDGVVIKEFERPAPDQTGLLDAFHQRGWPRHVIDPLPARPGESWRQVQRRLRDTVKNLNRELPPGTFRFRGDGSGHGVWWDRDADQDRELARV
jgi:hypothetical protein